MNQESLHAVWYGGRPPGVLLRALSGVYASVAAARRERERPDPALEGRPIIVVGNITAGGTGKTPLVIHLCGVCADAGLRAAVISRGHGRKSREAVRVDAKSTAAEAGDEPLLIARRCGVSVYVDRDREAAARRALVDGAEVVISDDGLQRRTMPRAVEICVVDGARGLGNGRMLPAGPLRERPERLGVIDFLVVNGPLLSPLPAGEHATMILRASGFVSLDGRRRMSLEEMREHCAGRSVHVMAGIGNPGRFFETLERARLRIDHRHAFDDHHRFRFEDFDGWEGVLLMTEKDGVKCAELLNCPPVADALRDAWCLQVDAELPASWGSSVLGLMRERVEAAAP